jgi:hypothetical protein
MVAQNWHASCGKTFIAPCATKTRTSEGICVKAEHRRHPRYRIQDAAFRVFNHGTQISGRLVNISKNGLAFQFAPAKKKSTACKAVDILGPGPDRFYISGIACRSIYEIGALAEGLTFTGAETRLCGLQFIGLTDRQTQKLTEMIDRYGVELRTIPKESLQNPI